MTSTRPAGSSSSAARKRPGDLSGPHTVVLETDQEVGGPASADQHLAPAQDGERDVVQPRRVASVHALGVEHQHDRMPVGRHQRQQLQPTGRVLGQHHPDVVGSALHPLEASRHGRDGRDPGRAVLDRHVARDVRRDQCQAGVPDVELTGEVERQPYAGLGAAQVGPLEPPVGRGTPEVARGAGPLLPRPNTAAAAGGAHQRVGVPAFPDRDPDLRPGGQCRPDDIGVVRVRDDDRYVGQALAPRGRQRPDLVVAGQLVARQVGEHDAPRRHRPDRPGQPALVHLQHQPLLVGGRQRAGDPGCGVRPAPVAAHGPSVLERTHGQRRRGGLPVRAADQRDAPTATEGGHRVRRDAEQDASADHQTRPAAQQPGQGGRGARGVPGERHPRVDPDGPVGPPGVRRPGHGHGSARRALLMLQ